MPTLLVHGRRLFYADHQPQAAGPALLLIHGAAGSHLVWPGPLRRLPETRVLALDLPGHGRSGPPGRRTIAHYAAVVIDFLNALGAPPVVIGGHSMGGAIALTAALAQPPGLRGLVLMSVAAQMRSHDALLGGALASLDAAATFIVDYGFADAPEALRRKVHQAILDAGATTTFGDFLACHRFDVRTLLPGIDTPALVIGGSADRMIAPRLTDALAERLPHARRQRVEGAGHFVMLERPEEVAGLVGHFLGDLRRASAARQHAPQ